MPVGYLVSTLIVTTYVVLALAPLHPRRSSPFRVSFMLGFVVNEVPALAFGLLVASTSFAFAEYSVGSPVLWIGVGFAVLASVGLGVIVRRSLRSGPAIERALDEGLGSGWRDRIDLRLPAGLGRPPSIARSLFAPFAVRPRDVERVRNIRYGDAGRWNRLDVYRNRSQSSGGPTLIHLHGGAFTIGRKSHEARPLLHRLASRGWVCISANYRLREAGRFPHALIDIKRVLAWVREHGHEYGADPDTVFVAGSSAGAHLAASAALTPNDPFFQPGFEGAETSVSAAICLYGYYGSIGTYGGRASSPLAHVGDQAPPFFVVHGDHDTVAIVAEARHFVEELHRTSSEPVVYAELPGAQHGFDFFHSIRFDAVVAAVEAFAAWVRSTRGSSVVDDTRALRWTGR
jgi:acetyl esterase/lipase